MDQGVPRRSDGEGRRLTGSPTARTSLTPAPRAGGSVTASNAATRRQADPPPRKARPRPSPLRRRPPGDGSVTTVAAPSDHPIRQHPEQQPTTRGGATSSVYPGATASGDNHLRTLGSTSTLTSPM